MSEKAANNNKNNTNNSNSNSQQAREAEQLLRIQPAPTADESLDYSIYSSGEMSAEQYYAAHAHNSHNSHNQQEQYAGQYQQQEQQHQYHDHGDGDPQGGSSSLQTQRGEGESNANVDANVDATLTVHSMHRKLLYLLSHPELFSKAMDWQSKVDRGLDPASHYGDDENGNNNNENNGIKSFDNEFEEQSRNTAAEEHKDKVVTDDGNDDNQTANTSASSKFKNQQRLIIPPLPLQIFAPDAEVVLPQALTASQLFGIERVTGIELEAAAGIIGLSQLFLRWLALMPEGDHMNKVIDPPGLTVMRISGGRYRVTGAHRVVWRWMNKFSPASMIMFAIDDVPSDTNHLIGSNDDDNNNNSSIKDNPEKSNTEEEDCNKPDTDFDFGDLVTMTIIDVFETDADGRLLSYCPTFDNRAVHKTQEVTERLLKGASHLKERMEVVARSPAGKSVNKAAGNLGKMSISAALAVGNIVKSKIEEEIHKHQHPAEHGEHPPKGGTREDVGEEEEENGGGALLSGNKNGVDGGGKGSGASSRGEGYFSDESSAASPRRMEV